MKDNTARVFEILTKCPAPRRLLKDRSIEIISESCSGSKYSISEPE